MEELIFRNKRVCSNCGSTETYRNQWYIHNQIIHCKKCENKLVFNPKWHPVTNPIMYKKWGKINHKKFNPINNPRDIFFRGKSIVLKENPRKGICKSCNKKIGDTYINCKGQIAIIKKTAMHHIEYHDEDPLKDTIELCISCHRKQHGKK